MGCDGGSIPRRSELVKTVKAPEKADANQKLLTLWQTCALSKQTLQAPIVSCLLGRLYNKSAILEFLLNKASFGDGDIVVPHVAGLKDLITLNLTPNPLVGVEQQAAIYSQFQDKVEVSPFVCPVTQREMNGHFKFCYLLTCGCVLSEQALKTVNSDSCLICNTAFTQDDVILINPSTEDEITFAQDRLASQKAIAKAKRQEARLDKKRKKDQEVPGLVALAGSGSDEDKEKLKKKKKSTLKQERLDATAPGVNISIPDLSSLDSMNPSKNITTLYNSKDGAGQKVSWINRGVKNRYQ